MYTNCLLRLDFQCQLMGRRDTGRSRRRWKKQDNSSFKGTGSRTYTLDTFVMVVVMKREKALDILHTECHECASFCFIGYQTNIVCLDLSSLRDFGNTRLYVRPRIYETWIIDDIYHCLWLMVCSKSGGWWRHVILGAKWAEWLRVTVCHPVKGARREIEWTSIGLGNSIRREFICNCKNSSVFFETKHVSLTCEICAEPLDIHDLCTRLICSGRSESLLILYNYSNNVAHAQTVRQERRCDQSRVVWSGEYVLKKCKCVWVLWLMLRYE
jgi:hypothetical protein